MRAYMKGMHPFHESPRAMLATLRKMINVQIPGLDEFASMPECMQPKKVETGL